MKNLIICTKSWPLAQPLKLSSIESFIDLKKVLLQYENVFILNPKSILDLLKTNVDVVISKIDIFKRTMNAFSSSYIDKEIDKDKIFGDLHDKVKIYLTDEELEQVVDSFPISKRYTRDDLKTTFLDNFSHQIVSSDVTPENFTSLTTNQISDCDVLKIVW